MRNSVLTRYVTLRYGSVENFLPCAFEAFPPSKIQQEFFTVFYYRHILLYTIYIYINIEYQISDINTDMIFDSRKKLKIERLGVESLKQLTEKQCKGVLYSTARYMC